MTPEDAIWPFLVKMYPLPTTSWRSASGIDHPSKKLSKITGYLASYPFNS